MRNGSTALTSSLRDSQSPREHHVGAGEDAAHPGHSPWSTEYQRSGSSRERAITGKDQRSHQHENRAEAQHAEHSVGLVGVDELGEEGEEDLWKWPPRRCRALPALASPRSPRSSLRSQRPRRSFWFGCREHTRTMATSVDAMLLGTYLAAAGLLIAMTRGRHRNAPQSTREAG